MIKVNLLVEARAEKVALMVDEHLGFVLEPPESRRMNDAVTVALKFAAVKRRRIGKPPTTRICRTHGIARKVTAAHSALRLPPGFACRLPHH